MEGMKLNLEMDNVNETNEPQDYVEPLVPDLSFIGDPKVDTLYTIILADGTEIKEARLNGDYYCTKHKVTEAVFAEDNLYEVIVRDDFGHEWISYNVKLVDLHFFEGKYWFMFGEYSKEELLLEDINAKLDYIAMMGGYDL